MSQRYETTAAILAAPGRLAIERITFQGPGPGQILLRMVAAGVCHTDMHFHDSPDGRGNEFPMILGHEGSGIVEAVGEGVTHLQAGDQAAVGCRVPCGVCSMCRRGDTRRCRASSPQAPDITLVGDGTAVNTPIGIGLFAELIPVDAAAAVRIDPVIPVDKVGVLGCAVMTGTGAVLHAAQVWPGAAVAVIGCGGIGLAAVQGAAAANADKVIAVDVTEQKLEWAKKLGATHTIDASTEDVVEEARQITDGDGVDFSFEAVGKPACVEQAMAMLAYGGTATIIGVPPPGAAVSIPVGGPEGMFSRTTTLTVTHGGDGLPAFDLPLFAQMYRDGKLDLDTMITHEVPLDRMEEGFDHMRAADAIRTIVRF